MAPFPTTDISSPLNSGKSYGPKSKATFTAAWNLLLCIEFPTLGCAQMWQPFVLVSIPAREVFPDVEHAVSKT